jgi:hypothetical protein
VRKGSAFPKVISSSFPEAKPQEKVIKGNSGGKP